MAEKWNLEGVSVSDQNVMTVTGTLNASKGVVFPAEDPLVAGAWWDNAGTLTKSSGE